jgi:hypothetical protein
VEKHIEHYVRKAHSWCARTKNRDTWISRLHHRISHYRVIEDAWPDASLISIHGRHTTSERVTYLIFGWGPYATNTRCASLISKKSKTLFMVRHTKELHRHTWAWERYNSLMVRHVDIENKCQMMHKVLFLVLLKDKLNTRGLLKRKNT